MKRVGNRESKINPRGGVPVTVLSVQSFQCYCPVCTSYAAVVVNKGHWNKAVLGESGQILAEIQFCPKWSTNFV